MYVLSSYVCPQKIIATDMLKLGMLSCHGGHWGGWTWQGQHICCSRKIRKINEGWAELYYTQTSPHNQTCCISEIGARFLACDHNSYWYPKNFLHPRPPPFLCRPGKQYSMSEGSCLTWKMNIISICLILYFPYATTPIKYVSVCVCCWHMKVKIFCMEVLYPS